MDEKRWKDDRSPVAQIAMAAVGATALCIYHRSWVDAAHLFYDIPAGLATFAYVAQLPLEFRKDGAHRFWLYRLATLVAMTIVTVGRQYRHWPISGHLSCVLTIALVQTADPRLPWWERVMYWIPVPIVLGLRLALLEHGEHSGTFNAFVFAFLFAVPGRIIAHVSRRDLMR